MHLGFTETGENTSIQRQLITPSTGGGDLATRGARHVDRLGGITDDVAAFDGQVQRRAQAGQGGLVCAQAPAG